MSVEQERHLTSVPEQWSDVEERPRFRVIEGGFDRAANWVRKIGTTMLVTFVIGLIGVLVLHATSIERQRELDAQRRQIDRLQVETEALRHQLAELEAPARIAAEAIAIGMIEPPSVTYLQSPAGPLDDRTLIVAKNQLAGE